MEYDSPEVVRRGTDPSGALLTLYEHRASEVSPEALQAFSRSQRPLGVVELDERSHFVVFKPEDVQRIDHRTIRVEGGILETCEEAEVIFRRPGLLRRTAKRLLGQTALVRVDICTATGPTSL